MSGTGYRPANGTNCETCKQTIPEYVLRELENEPVEELFPDVAFHIDACVECEVAYTVEFRKQGLSKSVSELRQIASSESVDQTLLQIVSSPVPNEALVVNPNWRQVAFDNGRGWIDLATERWQQVEIFLSGLASASRLEPAPAMSGLMSGKDAERDEDASTISVAPEGADWEMQIAFEPEEETEGQDLCRVDVAVTLHERFGDYSGAEVTLHAGETAQSAMTDELGNVRFGGVSCERLNEMRLRVNLP